MKALSAAGRARLPWMTMILLAAALLRLLHIGQQSLWSDEAWTWYVTQAPDFWTAVLGDVHPPLYFALARLWVHLVGDSEVALRSLSALWGVLGAALILPLGLELRRHLGGSSAWPVAAAALMAVQELDTYIGQEARMYSLVIVLSLGSMWAYLRFVRLDRRADLALWGLLTLVIIHTHYIAALLGMVQGLHALLALRGRQRTEAIATLMIAAALLLPWLLGVVLPRQLGRFSSFLSTDASSWETFWRYRLSWWSQQWPLWLGLWGLALWGKRQRAAWAVLILLLWWALPYGMVWMLNLRLPLLYDYRISLVVPPIALLAALGLDALARYSRQAASFALVVMLAYGLLAVDVYRPKEPWRAYAQALIRDIQPGEGLLLDFNGVDYSVLYYLTHSLPDNVALLSLWQQRTWHGETYERDVPSFMERFRVLWVGRWNDGDELSRRMILHGYRLSERRVFMHWDNELEILRYER
ncbi:MAG: glycosyltransferase family 39 protein [Anaerolineae bacterium]|nr:glycosyltransferase family 39 protein [Anaerolineae bacterium]MDW8173633.1 glycosyltransferase family 39 protein [Anaerolineae bacterium]